MLQAAAFGRGVDHVAAHVEDAGLERRHLLERDRDVAEERPLLLGRRLLDHRRELQAKLLRVRGQPVVVSLAQLDDVLVRHQYPTGADDGFLVEGLTLKRGGDLDRLDVALEHAGEGTLDEAFEPALETLQNSHADSLPGSG